MNISRHFLGFAGVVAGTAALGLAAALASDGASPRVEPFRPVRKVNPVTYTVRALYVFTPPQGTQFVHFWLVKPHNDAGQQVLTFHTRPEPTREVTDPAFGNRLLYFRFPEPDGAITVEYLFRVRAWELFWDLDQKQISQKIPTTLPLWTRSEKTIVADDPRIRSLAAEIIGRNADFPTAVFRILLDVIERMDYSHENCSLIASALHALEKREGHCSDYHGFSCALLRSLQIPSRLTYGFKLMSRRSPSHCMLEVYLPPYGWVPFDLAETDKVLTKLEESPLPAGEKERIRTAILSRFLSGWRPNVWIRHSIGTDIPIQPAVISNPPVIRTAYLAYDDRVVPDPDPANPNALTLGWQLVWNVHPDRTVMNPWELPYWIKETRGGKYDGTAEH